MIKFKRKNTALKPWNNRRGHLNQFFRYFCDRDTRTNARKYRFFIRDHPCDPWCLYPIDRFGFGLPAPGTSVSNFPAEVSLYVRSNGIT